MQFNPNDHIMKLKSKDGMKDYLPVQFRLVWFRESCPDGTIETELVHLDLDKEMQEEAFVWNNDKKHSEKVIKSASGVAIFRATVKDGKGGIATGTKMEKAASFADFIEKAETGAIGRALASLGYGTQFAPEFDEEHRIVDNPVERATSPESSERKLQSTSQENDEPMLITDQQKTSIRKLCEFLKQDLPDKLDAMSYGAAKAAIAVMSQEYRAMRTKQQAS